MEPDETDRMENAILAAHGAGDKATLARLYGAAGDMAEAAGDRGRAAFFLTHAWVFALDAGLPEARQWENTLQSWGRAPP